ncbi:hypothetical protein [Paenimyroides aestuarii]|uniref:DUF4440 domain-containing protein n=1 Tax=Paenimyroides aestuarii TaxID=2968490 RepID=A0ABY5NPR6_9FLAO|nr:hypothetical protein [Paenimyroides aestuarii]UUV20492.1 hypothetical protein NPX36_08945 [Paenimyroides aestuarii]
MKNIFAILVATLSIVSCAQKKENITPILKSETNTIMDLNKITNENVRKAIEALQNNDKTAFYSYFTKDVVFTDDGRKLDFQSFFDNAFHHKEKFLSIDTIENNGQLINGNFYAGQWGTFRVYFHFHENENKMFNRLDIGQKR